MQLWHFCSQILAFLFLRKILELGKFEGANFKYDNSIFKILAEKYPNKAGSKFRHFCFFCKILQLDKLEDANLKFDNMVFKFQPQNTQIRHFLFQF